MGWVTPTGHTDPEGEWTNPEKAYDGSTSWGDHAYVEWVGDGDWSDPLELEHAALDCDKLRFYCGCDYSVDIYIDLDAYYSGGWQHVYEGVMAWREWAEKSLGGTYSVTALSIRIKHIGHDFEPRIYEAEFGEAVEAPTVSTVAADPVGVTTATGKGNITDTGGENCDKRGIVYDLASHGDPGDTAPAVSDYSDYEEETNSFGTGAFNRNLTGLDPETKYYFRAYAHNSAGYSYGDELFFTTEAEPAAGRSFGFIIG